MAAKFGWDENMLEAQCSDCLMVIQLPLVTRDQFYAWREGMLIQRAMPQLTAGERELLISGLCDKCFNNLFA